MKLVIICSDGRVLLKETTGSYEDMNAILTGVKVLEDCNPSSWFRTLADPPPSLDKVTVNVKGFGEIWLIGAFKIYKCKAPCKLEVEPDTYIIARKVNEKLIYEKTILILKPVEIKV